MKLSFDAFMEYALYDPQSGYYFRPEIALGRQGDFTTAPEISDLFGACIAISISSIQAPNILELGAGSGKLALDILKKLEKINALPDQYFILERSGVLKNIQKENLKKSLSPELFKKIIWLENLPKENSFTGVMLSNEVCDAFAVKLFRKNKNFKNKMAELYVNLDKTPYELVESEPDTQLLQAVKKIESELGEFPEGYQSEINLFLKPWLNSLSQSLKQGMILIIDYGYARSEYYSRERSAGTLMCYYQHKAYLDPLVRVGEQDMTAHVDFTYLAEGGLEAGLDLLGYCPQMMFLADCGIEKIAAIDQEISQSVLDRRNALTKLMHPDLMGERFKVMGFGKEMPKEILERLQGFRLWDDRHKL